MKQLEKADAAVPRLDHQHRASISVRRHAVRLVRNAAEAALPLQKLKEIKLYNIAAIRTRANPRWNARLSELLMLLCEPPGMRDVAPEGGVDVPRSRGCTAADCAQRCAAGVIRRVSHEEESERPSLGSMHCFSVVEEARARRRAIDHPFFQNEAAYAAGYKSAVELDHVSSLLLSAYADAGCVSDISASFYGLALPTGARQFYRFRDNEGNLYEMCRGMMGHTVMAEVQHIITSVIAGHPDFVEQEFYAPCRVKIWIDNVEYTGGHRAVCYAREQLIEASVACNAAMQVGEVTRHYVFVGIEFDLEHHTVRISEKTRNKLPAAIPDVMTAGDLEALFGRLIWTAAVRQEPLANYYWCLKWARRLFNRLNRGIVTPEDTVAIRGVARRTLDMWLQQATQTHVVNRAQQGRVATLFTDASLDGWGAVLVDDTNRLFIAGARFVGGQALGDINSKEAWAVVNAYTAFADKLRSLSRLHHFVDNTSVQAALRRGQPRADALAQQTADAWRFIIGARIELSVDYVSTKLNPADAASRGQVVTVDAVNHAMGHANERRGAGSRSRFVVGDP